MAHSSTSLHEVRRASLDWADVDVSGQQRAPARLDDSALPVARLPVLSGAEITAAAERFADVDQTTALLEWTIATFGSRWLLASSWQHAVLVDQLARLVDRVPVVEFDTELLFAETHATRERILDRYAVDVISMRPARSVAEQGVALGPNLWERDPDRCCHDRKVVPLRQLLADRDAWVTGVRRGQSSTRRDVQVVEADLANGVVKVNPLARWTDADIDAYIALHDVPCNPMLAEGYPSIGCMPCTQPAPDGDARGGRWTGHAKTECGLHAPR